MGVRFSSWLTRPFVLRTLVAQARLAIRLFREPRVPIVAKAVPVLAALYLVSPFDVVPDFLPGLGQLDDLGVIIAALELFVRLSPSSAQAFHREAMAQGRRFTPMASSDDFIEAQWRHG